MEYTAKATIAEIINYLLDLKDFKPMQFSVSVENASTDLFLMDICGKVKRFSWYNDDIMEIVNVWQIVEVLDNTGWEDEDLDGDLANLKWQEVETDGEYHQYGVNFEN